jgi:hypothetical protein
VRSALVAAALLVAAAAEGAPPMRGVALGLSGTPAERRATALGEIAGLGADHVSLVVFWGQRDVRSVGLGPVPGLTVPDDETRAAVRAAHAAGLKVFLFPIVDVATRALGEWRGTLRPDDVAAWWQSYEGFILHYSALAADEGVELFAVGSELASTESWRERWFHLIGAVKRGYPGKLLYSANWDHYQAVSFWERVDYIGVSAYYELSPAPDASADELSRGWRAVRRTLTAYAARAERPLVLTEVGCPSQAGATAHPWDYTRSAPVDLEAQRRAYQALRDAWEGEPWLAGVFIWEWTGAGGSSDRGYTPRGKPAEAILRAWYRGPR